MSVESLQIRRRLARVWESFFAPFGGRLLPIQKAAILPVLEGFDTLVLAPAAGGKTEAVAAPLAQRILEDRHSPPCVAYVCPTRPLVNDLARRLAVPLGSLALSLDVRTGDRRRPVVRRPPHVLLTTPESLDSLLCRYPRLFMSLEALVLDEVHLLAGSARGDQVAILTSRLRHVVATAGRRLQVVALSATVGDPGALAERFLEDPRIATGGGARPILLKLAHTRHPDGAGRLLESAVKKTGARKMLVFVNRRQDAETLAAELSARLPYGGQVLAHHGSLARSLRESVERRFLDATHAAVVATSTLELGIDIGDVDLVVLAHPPPDVTTFLQRIGRGSRRSEESRVLAICRSAAEREWLTFLAGSAREGRLFPQMVPPRPSVVLQQLVSLLFQNRKSWVSIEALWERLPRSFARVYDLPRLERLSRGLIEAGLLDASRGRLTATARLALAHQKGEIHSNIDPEPPSVEVIDEFTRETLGTVGSTACRPGSIAIGGRGLKVVHAEPERIYVAGPATVVPPRYPPRPTAFVDHALAQAFGAHLGVSAGVPLLAPAGSDLALVHFAGSVASLLIGRWLEKKGLGEVLATRGLSVRFKPIGTRPIVLPNRPALEMLITEAAGSISRLLGTGPFGNSVPEAERVAWAREAIDLGPLVLALEHPVKRPEPGELPDGLAFL